MRFDWKRARELWDEIPLHRGDYHFIEYSPAQIIGAFISGPLILFACTYGVKEFSGYGVFPRVGFGLGIAGSVAELVLLWRAFPQPLRFVPLNLIRSAQHPLFKYFVPGIFWSALLCACLAAYIATVNEPWKRVLGFYLGSAAGRSLIGIIYVSVTGTSQFFQSDFTREVAQKIRVNYQNSFLRPAIHENQQLTDALAMRKIDLALIIYEGTFLQVLEENGRPLFERTGEGVVRFVAFTTDKNRITWDPNKRFPILIEKGKDIFARASFCRVPYIDIDPGCATFVRISIEEIVWAIVQKHGANPFAPYPFSDPPKGRVISPS